MGAQIFVRARIVRAGMSLTGVVGLRTAVWGVSVAGMFLVASAAFVQAHRRGARSPSARC